MKKIRSILAVVLSVMMLLTCFALTASAQDEDTVISVSMVNYNVYGLPSFSGDDIAAKQSDSAKYLTEKDFDIIAVQEDFGYHSYLVKGLTGYTYKTNHTGSIPGGDGLNIFTKTMPIYNEARYQWDMSYGSLSEGDTLTPKGIIYAVIDIGGGVYIDFYNIHADAFDGEGSQIARESNYNQLAALIEANYEKYGRPVVVTGDFNQHLHNFSSNSNMYEIFHERLQLKDAWVEIKNGGDYHDFSEWHKLNLDPWGQWDSVEKFLYKDGRNVSVEAKEFEYSFLYNENNERLSDHAAAECVIEFTVSADYVSDNTGLEVVTVNPFRNIINMLKWIIKDLITVFTSLDELGDLLS